MLESLYKFTIMSFGLCNAPVRFERMKDNILRDLNWKICLCYLDDILVFALDFDTSLRPLQHVLTC